MFGLQRVGDLVWAAADSRARGFLIGATAGRTTLSGEGLQHQDGSSHLVASTIPSCKAYDPCFQHEVALIVRDGIRRMVDGQEDVFYYLTTMNENYAHPAMPAGSEEGIVKGMYQLRKGNGAAPRVQLLGSGTILRESLAAADVLEAEHGVAADVWSVTSWTELRWDGMEAERSTLRGDAKASWAEACLGATEGPIVAATDYVRAVADLIRPYLPSGRKYTALGTDGFGRSDTRKALRAFFEVDRDSIVRAALVALGRHPGPPVVGKMRPAPSKPAPWTV